jgi:hypothetical protein
MHPEQRHAGWSSAWRTEHGNRRKTRIQCCKPPFSPLPRALIKSPPRAYPVSLRAVPQPDLDDTLFSNHWRERRHLNLHLQLHPHSLQLQHGPRAQVRKHM